MNNVVKKQKRYMFIQGASEKTVISESQLFCFILFKVTDHPQKSFYTQNKPLVCIKRFILRIKV